MKIETHRYQLKFKEKISVISEGSFREGALLRVTFDDGHVGYCDCHPWVEFGDLSLSEQLHALKAGGTTPLLSCSFKFCRLDAIARSKHCSLFEGLTIPASHLLVTYDSPIETFIQEDASLFKIKAGLNLQEEIDVLMSWITKFPEIYFRLDFNNRLNRGQFHAYWNYIPPKLRHRIDYVEDPYPFDPLLWKKDQEDLQIDFAVDQNGLTAFQHPDSARYIVHKPAVETLPETIPSQCHLVITSYLDHPLGQMCAAYAAAILKLQAPEKVHFCGLLTHHRYHDDPFITEMISQGPLLKPVPGTGFGFDSLLEALPWQSL